MGKLLITSIRKNLSEDVFLKQCILKDEESRISYVCKNINPSSANNFYGSKIDFALKNVEFKSEFIFPYYYYTYSFTIKNTNKQTTQYSEFTNSLISINYYVDVFGEIVETNGQKTSDNEALFNLNSASSEEKQYKVVFKDFFLFTWLGTFIDSDLTYETKLAIGFAVVVFIIALIGYFVGKPREKSKDSDVVTKSDEIYCPQCGKRMSSAYRFCKSCGKEL